MTRQARSAEQHRFVRLHTDGRRTQVAIRVSAPDAQGLHDVVVEEAEGGTVRVRSFARSVSGFDAAWLVSGLSVQLLLCQRFVRARFVDQL